MNSCLLGFCLRDSLEIVVLRASVKTISYLHISHESANGNCILCSSIKAVDNINMWFIKQSYLCKVVPGAYSPAGCARARAPLWPPLR